MKRTRTATPSLVSSEVSKPKSHFSFSRNWTTAKYNTRSSSLWSLHSWITAAIPLLRQWQRTTSVFSHSQMLPRPSGKERGSRGRAMRSEVRWKVARWQQSPRQQQSLHGEHLSGEAIPGGHTVQRLEQELTENLNFWNLIHLAMLNRGINNLVSLPAQHKPLALTRLLLTTKLKNLCNSKGIKTNEKSIYIRNYVLLVLLQDASHLNFSWSFMQKQINGLYPSAASHR